MNNENILKETEAFVRNQLRGAEGGHDWFHIQRVLSNARTIAQQEQSDELIVLLGALLHDIADSKFHQGNEDVGPALARDFLKSQQLSPEIITHVIRIIRNISFKGGNFKQEFRSPELDIVQDADRLDAMGAIGIARTFNYGGYKGRKLFDPQIPAQLKMSREEYKASQAPTINHFYEKLLLLKDRMNTETGKRMAEKRHRFMETYLEQFFREWNGKV